MVNSFNLGIDLIKSIFFLLLLIKKHLKSKENVATNTLFFFTKQL